MDNTITNRILLSVLVLPTMAGLAWWAWAGLPWLSSLLFIAGVVFLWWLWRPVVTGLSKK